MIKCYFVDIKNISSDLPRSNFVESELERLADTILATDGLLRPLILRSTGVEKYTVIEGHREYYAAVTAKQKDINKAEMVNAFVIDPNIQSSALAQLELLSEDRSVNPNLSTNTNLPTAQLLASISSTLAQQLQPIVAQLAEHQQILAELKLDRERATTSPKAPDPIAQSPTPSVVKQPKPADLPQTRSTTAPKPDLHSKKSTTPVKSTASTSSKKFDSAQANNTLDLINTLSLEQLTLRMERSGLSKTALKLLPNLIEIRDTQPNQKFDTWETIEAAKIKGLGAATIKQIIEKLK